VSVASQSDLVPIEAVESAIQRVLSIYGVSDVVVDAFDQFRKELQQIRAGQDQAE
jgi:hypothetical protein